MATVPPRILLVEDDDRIADAVCGGLRSEGFEVDRASEGQEARVLFEIKDYQVAILDRMLPGALDGLALCTRFRAQKPDCGLLMLTALGTTADKVDGLEAGADDYLVKPFDFEELLL